MGDIFENFLVSKKKKKAGDHDHQVEHTNSAWATQAMRSLFVTCWAMHLLEFRNSYWASSILWILV